MNRLSRVMTEAQRLVAPSPLETAKTASLARVLLTKTRKAAKRFPKTRGVLLGGSFAKGTWLPGNNDLDIFVKIDPSTPEEEFERIGLEIGALATRGYPRGKKFAQHPYTEATVDGVRVNIVPCYAVKKGKWKSAADRSPFHVEVVKSFPESMKTDVRMLKSFMNALGVYGAEIQRQGFSGYVAEVLVLKLKNLEGVLRWFAEYRPSNEGRIFSLPDPVDVGRDLGTAVSGESLGRMVLAAREFLRRPDLAFFRSMSGRAHSTMRGSVFGVVFSHKRLSEDTLWGELRKTTKHMVRHVEIHGFKVARSMAASNNSDRSAILLIPEIWELPPIEQRIGPTVDRKEDVEAFIRSNSKESRLVWVDDDTRVRLLKPRSYTRISDLLKDVIRGRAGPSGASREIQAGMKKSASVMHGEPLTRAASAAKWLQNGIREITSDAVGTR
ncbi:MAG TPA: CCA tRNA nucleotidyltransferase [Nitrososphaerales archaeon]|nr:CCA tRNA nucleotidyltransferase [Nitrososphaerales archaeon]